MILKTEDASPVCTLAALNAAIEKRDVTTLSQYVKIKFFDCMLKPRGLWIDSYRERSVCTYALHKYGPTLRYYLERAGLPKSQILDSLIELNYISAAWQYVDDGIENYARELGLPNADRVWVTELADLVSRLGKQLERRYQDQKYTSMEMYQQQAATTQFIILGDENKLSSIKIALIPWLAHAPNSLYRGYLADQFAESDSLEGSGKNAQAIKQFAQFFSFCEQQYGFSLSQSLAYFSCHRALSTLLLMKQDLSAIPNLSFFICQSLCNGRVNVNEAREMRFKLRCFFDKKTSSGADVAMISHTAEPASRKRGRDFMDS